MTFVWRGLVLSLALMGAGSVHAGVGALSAQVQSKDADRFVFVFEATGGAPTAADLQAGYLDHAGRGVEVFTPGRIESAAHLAATIAKDPSLYRRAIDVCLPIAKESSAELRAIYLAFEGLLDNPDLPDVYVVFGARNSGGTAAPDAQVLGLEVICQLAETEAEIRQFFRTFYAHETVHALQAEQTVEDVLPDPLLAVSMREGVADFLAWIVTGSIPHPDRHAWAQAREDFIWAEFTKDRESLLDSEAETLLSGETALKRWIGNAFNAPEGWPSELGYWVGMRICMAYFETVEDKSAAIRTLLNAEDYGPVLEISGYADRF